MPKLILMFKNKILNTFPLNSGSMVTIGRHPENDIVIQNLAVSGRHAHIEHHGDQIRLTDLKSKNGTFVNGATVAQHVLQDQDIIMMGKHLLLADLTDAMAADLAVALNGAAAPDTARTMILGKLNQEETQIPRPSKDCLAYMSGGQGEIALQKQVTIGKNQDADIVVGGPWGLLVGSPGAVIGRQAGDYYLRFAGGWVKPRHNGKSIRGTVILKHHDVVGIGPMKFKVHLSERAAA